MILNHICMTNGVAKRVANKVAKRYIRKILTSLKEKKVIERQGGNKTGKWVVILSL
ncbi:MAG: hypothetical protein IIT65_01395 [Lachnospiraceae bacterium]|nr:hypothetical protein [Lachnospiraceae bacterium]